jgi:hypothetical protein
MTKIIGATLVVALVAVASVALAHGPMWGAMGPGMMGGGPAAACPALGPAGAGPATPEAISEDKAKELATQYVDRYFKGYSIERVLPFEHGFRTMFQVELKGPKGDTRLLHVNPWGRVRPFGGPSA